MSRGLGVEIRAIALLRSRRNLVVVAGVAPVVVSIVFAVTLASNELLAATARVLGLGTVLLPLIVGHGMISGELRSGVAMLWLQKPVQPLAYFARRAFEIATLSVLLILSSWGAVAVILAGASDLEAVRNLLSVLPGVVLMVVCGCTLLFGVSAWGIQVDSMIAAVLFLGSAFSVLLGGVPGKSLAWIAVPIEALGIVGQHLSREAVNGHVGKSLLLVGRFLLTWTLIGTAGLFFSTRSPLPKEVAR
jgi:hypothetical protein